MGNHPSADEPGQALDEAPTSPKVTPAGFARRELEKKQQPIDDDALPPRSSAPVQKVTVAPPPIPVSATAPAKISGRATAAMPPA